MNKSTSKLAQFEGRSICTAEELGRIARILRGPDGCPWDREQTLADTIDHLQSEAEEVREALESGDLHDLKEELGDLLYNIVFASLLASETGEFDFRDVVTTIGEKLIRRHPHVFGEEVARTKEEALEIWNRVKQEEKRARREAEDA